MSQCQCAIQTSSVSGRSSWPEPVTSRSPRIAADLGIATSCLRRWMKQDDIDGGQRDGLSTDERAELVRLRRELRTAKMEVRDPPAGGRLLRQGDAAGPKMTYTFIARACDGPARDRPAVG